MDATVYVATGCLACERFLQAFHRLDLRKAKVIDLAVDVIDAMPNITAVPAVVLRGGQTLVGTEAFKWMQTLEAALPLEAYTTTLGAGTAGIQFTELASGKLESTDAFTAF